MRDRPGLSKGEMEVVRVLWGLGEATVRQVLEAFPPRRTIDFSTVQTYCAVWKRKVTSRHGWTGGSMSILPASSRER